MALDIEEDTIIAAGPMAGFLNTGKRLAVVSCLVLRAVLPVALMLLHASV